MAYIGDSQGAAEIDPNAFIKWLSRDDSEDWKPDGETVAMLPCSSGFTEVGCSDKFRHNDTICVHIACRMFTCLDNMFTIVYLDSII